MRKYIMNTIMMRMRMGRKRKRAINQLALMITVLETTKMVLNTTMMKIRPICPMKTTK